MLEVLQFEDPVLDTTDADGRWAFELSAPSMVYIKVAAVGFLEMRLGPFVETRSVELPPLTLLQSETVSVWVRDPEARALAGHRVVVDSKLEPASTWRPAPRRYITDEEGSAEVVRRLGERLEIVLPDRGFSTFSLMETDADLIVQTSGHSRLDRLVLTTPAGRPHQGAVAWVEGWPEPLAHADESDVVALRGLSPGRNWPLLVLGRDGSSASTTVSIAGEEGRAHTMVLEPDLVLQGTVLEADGRTPIEGALVWAGADPGRVVFTDSEGRFSLESLAGSATFIQAHHAGFEPRMVWLEKIPQGQSLRIHLSRTVVLAGRVVANGAATAHGVLISARLIDGAATPNVLADRLAARSVTHADGRFHLEGLLPGRAYDLVAESPQGGKGEMSWTVGSLGEPELRLAAPASFEGRVLDSDGNPVEAAEVEVHESSDNSLDQSRLTESGRDGSFLLEGVPQGLCELDITAPGYTPIRLRRVRAVVGQTTALGDLVLRQSAAVRLRVVGVDGARIAGARVRLLAPVDRWRSQLLEEFATAEDGSLEIGGLDADSLLQVHISKSGFLEKVLQAVRPGLGEIDVVLRPGAEVYGTVRSADGEPIAGATVIASHEEPLPGTNGRIARGVRELESSATREDGTFEMLDVPAGSLKLQVSAEGYVPSAWRSVVIEEGATTEGVDFQLTLGAVVKGEVVNSGGDQVGGSRVLVAGAGTFADEDGSFLVSGVPLGPQTISVDHPAYGKVEDDIEIGEGVNLTILTLELGASVEGEAKDSRGQPLSGAHVSLYEGAAGGRSYSTTTSEDGLFRFPSVEDGEYLLEGELPGYATARLESEVIVPGTRQSLELIFRRGAGVSGQIVGLDPIELSKVRLQAVSRSTRTSRAGTVDFDGGFEVANLSPGGWVLRASLEGGSRHTQGRLFIEPSDEYVELDLVFERGLTLEGIVLYDGAGLAAADVTLRGRHLAVTRRVQTDQEGLFEIQSLAPGPYVLSLRHDREWLIHNENFFLSVDDEVTIRLEAGSLSGRVTGPATLTAIDGSLLTLRRLVTSPEAFPFVVTTGSDAEGSFYFPRVPVGRYSLVVSKDGYSEYRDSIDIVAGSEENEIGIELVPTPGLTLDVRMPGASPTVVNVRLVAADSGQVLHRTRGISEEGLFVLPTVPAGEWEMLVGAPGSSLTATLASVPGPPVEVYLRPASELQVRIEGLEDSDEIAVVTAVGADGQRLGTLTQGGVYRDTWTVIGGIGRIHGVPPGLWTIHAETPNGRSWSASVVSQGDRSIEATLR